MGNPDESTKNIWAEFEAEIQNELAQSRKSLKEVSLMLEQSQAELNKLTQRNATVNTHLQQIQSQFETMPRSDIRSAYSSALDTQYRMLVMRGQLEKLQSDQANLQRLVNFLSKAQTIVADGAEKSIGGHGGTGGMAILEMVVNGQEAVRQRLSQQMHDGPAQALTNFILQLDIASRYYDQDPTKAKEELNNLRTAVVSTFKKVKGFISELRPMMLDDLGLFPTIQRYVADFKDLTGLDVNLSIRGQERRLEPYLEVMIFRAVQELLGNAARHNQDSPVRLGINVLVAMDDNVIRVSVSDNGKGFDPESLESSQGLGLKLIKERVDMLGGTFDVDASVGKGCKVSFQVPCLEPDANKIVLNI